MQPDLPRSAQRGFTLIEVLAALVIVSLGMLGVIQAVSQTASNSVYLRDKTLAHWIAMNRLTEGRLAQTAPRTLGAVLDRAGDVEGMDCHLVRPRETSRASAESGKRDLRSPA